MNVELLAIFGYIVLQVIIGGLLCRRISSEKDYFLAGRSLGLGLVTFSVFATWFGAETCIGSAGQVFQKGLSGGRADPFGYTICLILMGLLFSVKLWNKKLTTLGDFFKTRYSNHVEVLAILIMISTSFLWAAAQIRAFGQVISASSTMNVQTAITVAAFLTIIYTMLGGLLADVFTDFIQSIVLIMGLLVLFVAVIFSLDQPFEILHSIERSRLSLFPNDGSSFLHTMEAWMGPIIGTLVTQELVARMLASRTPNIARNSCYIASIIYLVVGLIPVILGILGPSIVSNLHEPEQLLPVLAKKYLPNTLYILFAGALISTILSTVDSVLLAISALLTHNIIVPTLKSPSEKKKVFIARIFVIISGIIAYIIAFHASGIYDLVENSSVFGSTGIFVITLFGLFTRFGNKWSAMAALVSGALSMIIGKHFMKVETPFLISLITAFSAYILPALWIYAINTLRRSAKVEVSVTDSHAFRTRLSTPP